MSFLNQIDIIVQQKVSNFCQVLSEKYNIPKSELTKLWKEEDVNPTAEIKSPITEKPKEKKCPYFFTRGKKKNTYCGAKLKDGNDYCSKHKNCKKPVEKPVEKPTEELTETPIEEPKVDDSKDEVVEEEVVSQPPKKEKKKKNKKEKDVVVEKEEVVSQPPKKENKKKDTEKVKTVKQMIVERLKINEEDLEVADVLSELEGDCDGCEEYEEFEEEELLEEDEYFEPDY